MVPEEKPGVWLDLDVATNDNDPIPSDFSMGSGRPVDPRVLEIARILGRQAARELLEQAANDNAPRETEPNKMKEPVAGSGLYVKYSTG